MGFKSDLELGNAYEIEFLKYIEYDKYLIMKGNFKPYDIEIYKDNIKTKYEVKCDRIANRTGNLCIEYICNNKGSGITTTEADYWVYFIIKENDTYDYYKIPTEEIKLSIASKKYFTTMKGGDGYKSNFYLFKYALFEKYKNI
ncbi:hypothetical protein GW820_06385 [archaeon]|nr:hypothetical protein [archaeon]